MSAPPQLDRRLAAVWFADVVGFTSLADSDEDAALATVGEFQSAARAAVEGRGGRVVKFLGDGALAEFASARAAESLELLEPAAREAIGTGAGAERRFLEALVRHAGENDWPLFYSASVKAALGDVDAALTDLRSARDEGDGYLVRAAVAPQYDPLRGDPRFAPFLASIGLADIPLPAEQPAR